MIVMRQHHLCDYCHKDLENISRDEYLREAKIVCGRHRVYEFCSMSCYVSYYLIHSRRKSIK